MKKCYKCNVLVNSNIPRCPLCQTNIDGDNKDESVFPVIPNMYKKHKLVFKLLLFLSVFGCVLSTIINYIMDRKIGWAWFVIAGIISFWITFIIGVKRRHNFMKLLFAEVMLLLISSIIWDYFTGWYFWSITYVIYIYINSLIGLAPLYFIIRNKLSMEWPSILCVVFSIISILALAIFNHKQMMNELERRLHI